VNVLIVEDDARIAGFLERGLRAEGHRVQVARTGTDGLALALEAARSARTDGVPTVLLLDVMLPCLNGLEVCQTLRAAGIHLPILMLSAAGTLEDRVGGLRLGADDYLTKPFEFEELLARLEALARRGREQARAAGTRLAVADLVFDREAMRASRAGRPIALTARELALLELLMSAPGRLFSRERILANVWGSAEDPLTNVVDVYIRRLRAKLDDGHPVALIHTVRGMGYRLEDPRVADPPPRGGCPDQFE
jgi:DNA-binding response OmpR family regulator